ncbi:uncharacterized protein [Antedon mediterranea]|uniref:uncharacterized protein isoform X2 n=1 Tax=Antedon mediterranea TaxID=105859 RepID=UPI003AF76C4D
MTDDHKIETLIAEVEQNPMLYDKSDPNFKNIPMKRDMWQDIGMRTGMSGELARKKWNNVRDAFNSSRKKVATDKVIKKYKYADILTFLTPHFRDSSLEIPDTVSEEEHYNSVVSIIEHNEDEYNHIRQDNPSFVSLTTSTPALAKRRRPSTNFDANDCITEYLAQKAKIADAQKDDLDYFFCSMAETIRRMPERVRIELKFNIHQMVHKAELDLLKN